MTDADPKPELEIKSDSDWKQKVKQESAQLDAKRQEDPSPSSAGSAAEASADPVEAASADDAQRPQIDASQLPPADFTMLVTMFSTQAMVSLGAIPSPDTGQPEQNLILAKHFIDLLGVLQDKTRRNLTGHESNLLENSLHELRLAYIELSKADTGESST